MFSFQARFGDEAGTEYIYKEPKVTSLAEIAERLNKMYCAKFGSERVKLAMDSNPVCFARCFVNSDNFTDSKKCFLSRLKKEILNHTWLMFKSLM